MIRIISTIFSFIVIMTLTGCSSQDEPAVSDMANEETISFSLRIDSRNVNEPATRSLAPGYHFGDGASINTVKCYVYNLANGSSAEPSKVIDIPLSSLSGNFTIRLPRNQTFDLVFLATSIEQTDASSKLYYNSTDRSLKVNYNNCNDEEYDCFFATVKNVTTETSMSDAIVLRRPFAQINVGARNLAAYNSNHPISSVSLTVNGIYDKLNLMDGSLIGDPVNISFSDSAVPTGQTFPVDGNDYLAMNYVLVNTRCLTNVVVTVNHSDATSPKSLTVENVALERNYQSNICIKSL